MILVGKYSYKRQLRNIVIDTDCLKALIKIFQAYQMEYNLSIEYRTGETLSNVLFEDVEKDIFTKRRRIKEVTITAEADCMGVNIMMGSQILDEIEIVSDKRDNFIQLKQELQDWQELYKNKNPLIVFAPLTVKSEILRGITSLILSFLTILPMMISEWMNGGQILFGDAVMIITVFGMIYYLVILGLSAFFLRSVEIDIGDNRVKFRRKVAGWIFTVIIIPVILSWILSLS